MRFRMFAMVSTLALMPSLHAIAAPATPEQADKIAKGIESYIGSKPGLVTVKPNGESYDVTVDYSAYGKMSSSGNEFSLSPLHYKVSDSGGGKWSILMDEPVTGNFKFVSAAEPKQPSLEAKFNVQIKSVATYEESSGLFTESIADAKDMTLEESFSNPDGGVGNVQYTLRSMHQEMHAARQGDGVNAKMSGTMQDLVETINISGGNGTPPMAFTLSAAKGSQSADLKGMKIAPLKELVQFAVTHANDTNRKPLEDELRKLATQALPVFNRIVADTGMEQVTVETSIGQFKLDKATVNLAANGFVSNGEFSEGVAVEGLTLPPGLLPAFAVELLPQRVAFDVKLADFDLAEAAKVFIAEVDSSKASQPELDAKLAKVIVPSGKMTISTSTTEVSGKAYGVSLAGDMRVGPAVAPSGQGVIKAKGLDEIVKQLQSAPPEAGTAQAVAGILMAKGFGKVEGDSVTWNIEAQPGGAVLINGVDVSKLAGGPPQQQ